MYDFAKQGVQLLTYKNAHKWEARGARIVSISLRVIASYEFEFLKNILKEWK